MVRGLQSLEFKFFITSIISLIWLLGYKISLWATKNCLNGNFNDFSKVYKQTFAESDSGK